MAKKSHPYIDAIKISALIFFSMILIIFFIAAYVNNKVADNPAVPIQEIEKNLTPPGKVYPRQN